MRNRGLEQATEGTMCSGGGLDAAALVDAAEAVSRERPPRGCRKETPIQRDLESHDWVERLRPGHPRHRETVSLLHTVLGRVAAYELTRHRRQLGSFAGPEFDDLAQQAADDALVSILARLDEFKGLSRFTTWCYRFAALEVSAKVARHAWRRQPPSAAELAFERLPDSMARRPGPRLEQREQLAALSVALGRLTERQRDVFVAVALNEVSTDVLATRLGTNRNAIYKNLFDARRSLRAGLAAAGYPVREKDAA